MLMHNASHVNTLKKGKEGVDPLAAALVLPGGESMRAALERPGHRQRHRTFSHDKQTYLDIIVTDRKESTKIQWRD